MIDYNKIIKENSILESNRLILRLFTVDDVEDVYLYASDDIVTKYLTWASHTDISQTEKVLNEFFIDKIGVLAMY